MLKMELNLTFQKDMKHNRREMFNLRNDTSLKQFKTVTTNTDRFSKKMLTQETLDVQFKRWQRQLKNLSMPISEKSGQKMKKYSNFQKYTNCWKKRRIF